MSSTIAAIQYHRDRGRRMESGSLNLILIYPFHPFNHVFHAIHSFLMGVRLIRCRMT